MSVHPCRAAIPTRFQLTEYDASAISTGGQQAEV